MIIIDYESYPDHRKAFFEFIKAIGESFVSSLEQIPIERLKVILDSIIWAGKHKHPEMSELGLKALESLLVNISGNP
jgi:exportin-1